jgi:GT2 family glycosyltransferase
MTRVSCVVLSMGNRVDELTRLLACLDAQRDVELERVVVGNGWRPTGLPADVVTVALAENAGVTEGRNVGARAATGDILCFLDDDVTLRGDDVLASAVAEFDRDPTLGVLQLAAVDSEGAPTGSRHVPRLGGVGHDRPGDVAVFWEGACLIRRTAFEQVGGWPSHFFYGHEGIEVAWRMIDCGFRVHYAAGLTVDNPHAEPFSGVNRARSGARNRVWVARRNLPMPLAVGYVVIWMLATIVRGLAHPAHLAANLAGFRAGLTEPAGERRPIRWSTAWRLTRLGRPPIV